MSWRDGSHASSKHGTISRYVNGHCRCSFCKEAWRLYRAQKRAEKKS